jgi:hypothetical protein
MSYNGWANWATWNVELWIDNDEGMYRAKQEFIRNTEKEDIHKANVEDFVKELMPEGTPDMKQDFYADHSVNWQELAEHWQQEKDELE